MVKIDSKKVISRRESKSVSHSVVLTPGYDLSKDSWTFYLLLVPIDEVCKVSSRVLDGFEATLCHIHLGAATAQQLDEIEPMQFHFQRRLPRGNHSRHFGRVATADVGVHVEVCFRCSHCEVG